MACQASLSGLEAKPARLTGTECLLGGPESITPAGVSRQVVTLHNATL